MDNEQVMEVSPAVFSEISQKSYECWAEHQIWPGTDQFADWACKTFGCVLHTTYRVVVIWEWGTQRKWAFRTPEEPITGGGYRWTMNG